MFLHLNKLSINKLICCEYHFEVEIARRVMININYILKQWHSSELKRNNLYSFSVFTLSLSTRKLCCHHANVIFRCYLYVNLVYRGKVHCCSDTSVV